MAGSQSRTHLLVLKKRTSEAGRFSLKQENVSAGPATLRGKSEENLYIFVRALWPSWNISGAYIC